MKANATDGKLIMYIKFTKKTEMNVYMYKGKAQHQAKEPIVEENKQINENEVYELDVEDHIVIIAFPNKDKDTEFSFNYWIAPYKEPYVDPWYEFAGPVGENIFMVLCLIATLLLICIICTCCYCTIMNFKNCYAKRREAQNAKLNEKVNKIEE